MSWKVASGVAAGAFLLSFISAGLGGSAFWDMLLRALFWGAIAFAAALGIEMLLRQTIPELFRPALDGTPEVEAPPPGRVDITLEAEPPLVGGFVRELGESADSSSSVRSDRAGSESDETLEPSGSTSGLSRAEAVLENASVGEDELPEIGSFLDSFKPQEILNGESAGGDDLVSPAASVSSPWVPESGPTERGSGDVILDGQAHDPTELAKAVQTVMKKGQ